MFTLQTLPAEPDALRPEVAFVLLLTTRAPLQGGAGVGWHRDAPAFPGEREGFMRLNDKGSGRLRQMAASICRRRPGFSWPQLAPTGSRLT